MKILLLLIHKTTEEQLSYFSNSLELQNLTIYLQKRILFLLGILS